MKLKKNTYKITCLLVPVLLILPALIINLHLLLHQHTKAEIHYHDTTTFCDDEVSICSCCDFIFTFSSSTLSKTYYKLTNLMFKSIDLNSIESNYFNLFLGHKKGRSPPQFV